MDEVRDKLIEMGMSLKDPIPGFETSAYYPDTNSDEEF